MAVTLINGFVLLPHRANWSTLPQWSRAWQTEVTEAVTGDESRFGFRAKPRISLTWLLTPRTLQEQAQLDDRVRAALKSGKACAPFWGRASTASADVDNVTVTLSAPTWSWKIGDYIFFQDEQLNFDVRQVSNVVGNVLTLSLAVSQTYKAGLVWPLLFGKPTAKDMSAETNYHGAISITLQELVSRETATVGAVVPSGAVGIGVMKIGTTFVVA